MALRAGYYGVKRWLWDKLQSVPGKVDTLIDNNNVTGVRNLLPNNLVNKTDQSVTFTHDADGAVSLSGTAAANVDAAIYDTRDSGELWRGLSIIVSKGIENENIKILVNAYNDTTYVKTLVDLASGTESAPITFDYTGYNRVRVTAYVKSGNNTTGKKIYPMFRLASDPDDTYESFAMTNRQLTTDKVSKTLVSTDAKTTIFSESTKVSSVTAILNDLLVSLRLTSISGASASGSWTTIATLNEAYRPAGLVYEVAIDDSGNPFGWVRIHGDTGVVEVYQGSGSVKTVNLSSLYFRNTSTSANRDITPDERSLDVEVEESVVVKKATTRKSTKKTEEEE